jgi:serine/threonine protein kinase
MLAEAAMSDEGRESSNLPVARTPKGGRARRERHIFAALDLVFEGEAPLTPDGKSYEVALDPTVIPTAREGRAACARARWEANPTNPVPRVAAEKSVHYWQYLESAPDEALTVISVPNSRAPVRLVAQVAWVYSVRPDLIQASPTAVPKHTPIAKNVLGRYRLGQVIGRGGHSVVYEAEQLDLGRKVAVKVLPATMASADEFRRRFERESRIASAIEHPNIIPIYDAGESGGELYIVMRLVPGRDLGLLIQDQGPLHPTRTMNLLRQISEALEAAHDGGLIHRDVKPANILITDPGRPSKEHAYLADFGVGKMKLSSPSLTVTGDFLGTVNYVAPEQIRGQDVDRRADVYSLGCILFECLTGRVPFQRDHELAVVYAHINDAVPLASDLIGGVPKAVDDIVIRAMAKNPDDRYDTAMQLIDAAGEALETIAGPPHPHKAIRAPEDESPAEMATQEEFHKAMINLYDRTRRESGYVATRFIRLVSQQGGLAAARMLLASSSPSEGFTALWERRRLDLSLEALVLDQRYRHLFTAPELETAANRLREYGYDVPD